MQKVWSSQRWEELLDTLKDLIARIAQPGRVTWIGLRPGKRVAMQTVTHARIGLDGLDGDRSSGGKRAVTLLQAEHLPAIGAYLGRDVVSPLQLRRNIVVAGINLSALKSRQVRLGAAVVEMTSICAPCSRMEEAFGPGGYSAVRGHGGWCARVVTPGLVKLDDVVDAFA